LQSHPRSTEQQLPSPQNDQQTRLFQRSENEIWSQNKFYAEVSNKVRVTKIHATFRGDGKNICDNAPTTVRLKKSQNKSSKLLLWRSPSGTAQSLQ